MNPLLPPITVNSSDTDFAIRGAAKQEVTADDSGPSFKEAYDKQAKVKKTAKAEDKPAREAEPAEGRVREQRESKPAGNTKTKEKAGAVTESRAAKTPASEDVRAEAQTSDGPPAGTEEGTSESSDDDGGLVGPVLPESLNGESAEQGLVGEILNSVVASGQVSDAGIEGEAVSVLGENTASVELGENTPSAEVSMLGLAGNTEGVDARGLRDLRGSGFNGPMMPSGASAHLAAQAGTNTALTGSPLEGLNKPGALSVLEVSGDKLAESGRFFSRSIEQFAARSNVTDASAVADPDSGKKLSPSIVTSNFMSNMTSASQKPLSLVSKDGGLVGETLANFADQIESSGKAQPFAQAAAGVAPGASVSGLAAAADARVQLPVSITFGQSGWANMVAERSAMMAAQSIKFAELQLDPPELGPLMVKVSVNQDQAIVSFVASNAQVKEALDQSLVRLKEMLEEQGLDLVNVDVSDQASQDADADAESESQTGQSNEIVAAEEEQVVTHKVEVNAGYGVDHYA